MDQALDSEWLTQIPDDKASFIAINSPDPAALNENAEYTAVGALDVYALLVPVDHGKRLDRPSKDSKILTSRKRRWEI